MAQKKTKKQPLTLHGLLVAMSYWGSSVRLFLAAFVSLAIFAIALSETGGKVSAVSGEVITLIYVLGSMLLLDAGYVIIARALPLRRRLDIMSLLVADLGILGLYAMPKLAVSTVATPINPVGIALLIASFVLSLRLLTGFLFSTKRSK